MNCNTAKTYYNFNKKKLNMQVSEHTENHTQNLKKVLSFHNKIKRNLFFFKEVNKFNSSYTLLKKKKKLKYG